MVLLYGALIPPEGRNNLENWPLVVCICVPRWRHLTTHSSLPGETDETYNVLEDNPGSDLSIRVYGEGIFEITLPR